MRCSPSKETPQGSSPTRISDAKPLYMRERCWSARKSASGLNDVKRIFLSPWLTWSATPLKVWKWGLPLSHGDSGQKAAPFKRNAMLEALPIGVLHFPGAGI